MNQRCRIRLVAGALAALWLALPVAAAVHVTVEAHEYCVEHQALEHVRDGADAASYEGDAIAVTSATEDHSGCYFDHALLREVTALDAAVAAVIAVDGDADAVVVVGPAPVVIAVLDVAPKTSPPPAA